MTRYVSHPARFLHKIGTLSYAEGALVEPLSVAAGAVSRAQVGLGQPVLVCGAGPIGLAAALCARAAGAHPICVTDLEQSRLDQAKSLGIELTVRVNLAWTRQDFAEEIRSTMGSDCPPEIAFECPGSQPSIAGAIYVGDRGKFPFFSLLMHISQALVDGGTLLQV